MLCRFSARLSRDGDDVESEMALRLRKIDALIDLARSRLRSPDRERVVGKLEAAKAMQPVRQDPADDMIVQRAEEKLSQAEADRAEKRRPYESDPLFMYLWRRRFGTRDYHAGSLVRYFDRKVAHLIGFENARVNYAMLMELPDRLREHVERLRAERAAGIGGGDDRQVGSAPRAVEELPEIQAMLRQAAADPGSDEPTLRRIEELDAALGSARAEPSK